MYNGHGIECSEYLSIIDGVRPGTRAMLYSHMFAITAPILVVGPTVNSVEVIRGHDGLLLMVNYRKNIFYKLMSLTSPLYIYI